MTLQPVLRTHGSRINLETHGDVTTFELVRLVEAVGEEVLGICLDTANVVLHGEHPLAAAGRAAPYTHITHCKDAIVFFVEHGLRRQTLPPGEGMIDWNALVTELTDHQPDLILNIEDHKWFFDAEIFEEHWIQSHPDLAPEELLQFLKMAWHCSQQIAQGVRRDPQAYETIAYGDEMEARLIAGREHLSRLFAG